jgi:hypothetical protein
MDDSKRGLSAFETAVPPEDDAAMLVHIWKHVEE